MSTRKTTFFYGLLIAVASLAVGMVIASRLDLSPESSAQTHGGARREQRAADRPDRRARRSATSPRRTTPTVVNIRTESRQRDAGADRVLRRRRRSVPPLLRRQPDDAAVTHRGRKRQPREQVVAGRRHRLHHQQGRLHPDEQPRRRGRDEDHGVALRRGHGPGVRREACRPRPADRQRAHRTHREAGSHAARDRSSATRRRCSRATG